MVFRSIEGVRWHANYRNFASFNKCVLFYLLSFCFNEISTRTQRLVFIMQAKNYHPKKGHTNVCFVAKDHVNRVQRDSHIRISDRLSVSCTECHSRYKLSFSQMTFDHSTVVLFNHSARIKQITFCMTFVFADNQWVI